MGRRNKPVAVVGAMLAAAAISGCATIGTLSEDETKNKIYSGTIRHAELACAHAVCLDLPFSLAADTLLLPVTVPWSAVNLFRKNSGKAQDPNSPSSSATESAARDSGVQPSQQ
jgi:uncharacterized protein YceK